MNITEGTELLRVVIWPAVVAYAIWVVRPHLVSLLRNAKIVLNVAGQSIEMNLTQIKDIIETQTGGPLSSQQLQFLLSLEDSGELSAAELINRTPEIDSTIRPLRNMGLVATHPRNAFLQDCNTVTLTGLGRLYIKARRDSGGH